MRPPQYMLNVQLFDERSKNLLYQSAVDLGTCQIPLRGASYGAYLRGTLNVMKGGKDRRAGEVFGTVAMGTVKPEANPLLELQALGGAGGADEPNLDLWRQYAQTGELDPPELLVYPPYNNCYLVVKIIRCCEFGFGECCGHCTTSHLPVSPISSLTTFFPYLIIIVFLSHLNLNVISSHLIATPLYSADNLPAADQNGSSDPYVTVEYAGERHNTGVQENTLNPEFNETKYFRIKAAIPQFPTVEELSENPYFRINVWDVDSEFDEAQSLGSCKVFLSEVTGGGRMSQTLNKEKGQVEHKMVSVVFVVCDSFERASERERERREREREREREMELTTVFHLAPTE